MAEHQGPRRHAVCEIDVDGVPITSKIDPYLISVQVLDSVEGAHSECHIELDDRNAELQIPPDGVSLVVRLGWAGEGPRLADSGRSSITTGGQGSMDAGVISRTRGELAWGGPGIRMVFTGSVSEVESGFGRRGGGRRLWITATSGNVKGLAKEPQKGSWGAGKAKDGAASDAGSPASGGAGAGGAGAAGASEPEVPLEKVLTEIFGKAGLTVKLSPEMKKITQSYWHINQSPQAFGEEAARRFGGIFKIENGIASLVGKFEGVNADGQPLPTVDAFWGVNLIGWRIKPYAGRPQWGAAAARYFDTFEGVWKVAESVIGGTTPFGGTTAIASLIMPVADKTEADNANKGTDAASQSRRGVGWVLINGEPEARAGNKVHISNARPGVDGTYLITSAEHNYTRGVGYTTRMNVQAPTPDYGGYGWTRDPGKFKPEEGGDGTQSLDPTKPGYVAPVIPLDQLPESDKERMRMWLRQRGLPYPPGLTQSTDPAKPGYVAPTGGSAAP